MRYITLLITVLLGFSQASLSYAQQNKSELANLVCFVRFADEDESIFDKTIDHYQQLFNAEDESAVSVYNYFQQASYKQLKWKSIMSPEANGQKVVSYKAQRSRGYYLHYTSINTEGYDENNAADALLREQNLVKEITDYISTVLPADVKIDANGDGVVDNICIILSGNSEVSARYMFWPHRSTLYIKQGFIHEKRVNEYIMLFDGANGWSSLSPIELNAGVLCHEMSHTLGTRDLYHTQKGLNPVGVWDLMSDNLLVPQGMSAFTKSKYCKWIDEIPEISTPGVYTLNPVGGASKEKVAYKVKPVGSDEYFVLEYRKQAAPFENGLPSSGLLVYRINPNFTGNEGYDGVTKFDEQYLFRPGGTTTSNGNISEATFSLESGRTAFGGVAANKPFYYNGREANFAIANVSACGETISFELLASTPQIHLSQTEISLNGYAGSSSTIKVTGIGTGWIIKSLAEGLTASLTNASEGTVDVTIAAKAENKGLELGYDVLFESTTYPEVTALLKVTQKSSAIQAPYGLKAEKADNTINLTWQKPLEGTPVFTEDFENIENKDSWTIKTVNNVGWVWQETVKYKLPYEGNYSVRLNSEIEDRHQDEWFISPKFSNGTVLSFYSNSLAPNKNNLHNFYYVEVSKDGGNTWTKIFDLKAQGTAVNKYEHILIDLSDYLSDDMRVAFHAYDDNNEGLSYWWHVDNILIYPKVESSIIKEYHIYRNDQKIGVSATPSFVDNNPVVGVNVYKVQAVGDFGTTAFSNESSVDFSSSAIWNESSDDDVQLVYQDRSVDIVSESLLSEVILYDLTGAVVYRDGGAKSTYSIGTSSLSKGVYIARVLRENKQALSFKVLIK